MDFNRAYSLNSGNPGAVLGFAKWHFSKNNYTSAKEYIQSTKEIDPDGVFGHEADELLIKIEATEKTQTGSLNMSGSTKDF